MLLLCYVFFDCFDDKEAEICLRLTAAAAADRLYVYRMKSRDEVDTTKFQPLRPAISYRKGHVGAVRDGAVDKDRDGQLLSRPGGCYRQDRRLTSGDAGVHPEGDAAHHLRGLLLTGDNGKDQGDYDKQGSFHSGML